MTQRFVAEGAYVFITGRPQRDLDAAVRDFGKNDTGIQGHLNLADVDRFYATVKQQKGRINVLFANGAGLGEFAPRGNYRSAF
jgi:NAD(P)-dependent dehydrogenase (short-subunit alcohol dehydrogenase family)